jgi:hypothetical protein
MSRRNRNTKGYSPRKVNTRELRQRFLIVCEGKKTEPGYFRSFRVPKEVAEIDIHGLGANPSQLVHRAKELQSANAEDYDQTWCVFDRDDWTVEDFKDALREAERNGIKVAYSNEAFELWYVLHFEFLNTGIPRPDYLQKLSLLLKRPYRKNSTTIYDDLITRQPIAIKHAEKLLSQYDPCDPTTDNPSTTVHLLVQELNRFVP